MSRISEKFSQLKKDRKKAVIFFMTAGDPGFKKNAELALAFEKDGVDLLELGVPFSDPLADGPVIQASSRRALEKGTTLSGILKLVKEIRRKSKIPILLMSYLNPVLSHGAARFAREAKAAGVDGVIFPDLPPDEGGEIAPVLKKHGIDVVYLLAPTSTPERRRFVCRASRGFVYYVSITGVTGVHSSLPAAVEKNIREAKKETKLPVCVGFGVSTPEQARTMARIADGVIVGSAVVKALEANPRMAAAAFSRRFARPFVAAVKGKA
jgi:tryptophan synthase alpha chain